MSLQLLHPPLKLVLHHRHYQTHCVSQSPPPTQISSLSTSPVTNTAPTITGKMQFNIKVLSCFLVVGFVHTLCRSNSSERLGLNGTFTHGDENSGHTCKSSFPIYEELTHAQTFSGNERLPVGKLNACSKYYPVLVLVFNGNTGFYIGTSDEERVLI
jgi:hypothetical protein